MIKTHELSEAAYWREKYYFVLSRVLTAARPCSEIHPFGFEVVAMRDQVLDVPVHRFKAALGEYGQTGVDLESGAKPRLLDK